MDSTNTILILLTLWIISFVDSALNIQGKAHFYLISFKSCNIQDILVDFILVFLFSFWQRPCQKHVILNLSMLDAHTHSKF